MESRRILVWFMALVVAWMSWRVAVVDAGYYTHADCRALRYDCACNWAPLRESAPCSCGYVQTYPGNEHCCTSSGCGANGCMRVGPSSLPTSWSCSAGHPNCQWSSWVWSGACSATCGTGTRRRERTCSLGNDDSDIDTEPCSAGSCVCRAAPLA